MDKEQQNIAWESIPKDVRTLLRQEYAKPIIDDFSEGYNSALNDTFGDKNLTSDEEPEEILTVSAKKARELHAKAVKSCSNDEDSDLYYSGYIEALEDAFGKDKCLPDPSEERLEQTLEQSVQADEKPTPKFKIGDKVTMVDEAKKSYNGVGTIIEVRNNHGYAFYRIKEHPALFAEQYLKPHTEPKFKIGDIVKVKNGNYGGSIMKIHNRRLEDYGWIYDLGEKSKDIVLWFSESELEPYTEPEPQQTEETMEEKELNLATLLNGCEGEEFYALMIGKCRFDRKSPFDDKIIFVLENGDGTETHLEVDFQGRYECHGVCVIYPSRDLYLKYPLEAAKAWQIWAEERKPKIWRAEKDETYYSISADGSIFSNLDERALSDNDKYHFGNYFRTETEAKQAAEAVKRTLEEFHEKNAEK